MSVSTMYDPEQVEGDVHGDLVRSSLGRGRVASMPMTDLDGVLLSWLYRSAQGRTDSAAGGGERRLVCLL
jgi:hypothetical protein